MTDSVAQRLQELREQAERLAKAAGDRAKLDHYRKVVLAEEMVRAEKQGHQTAAAQEREARCTQRYKDTLDAYGTAVEIHERERWNLKISEWGLDLWRTKQATKRAEMQHLHGPADRS